MRCAESLVSNFVVRASVLGGGVEVHKQLGPGDCGQRCENGKLANLYHTLKVKRLALDCKRRMRADRNVLRAS